MNSIAFAGNYIGTVIAMVFIYLLKCYFVFNFTYFLKYTNSPYRESSETYGDGKVSFIFLEQLVVFGMWRGWHLYVEAQTLIRGLQKRNEIISKRVWRQVLMLSHRRHRGRQYFCLLPFGQSSLRIFQRTGDTTRYSLNCRRF